MNKENSNSYEGELQNDFVPDNHKEQEKLTFKILIVDDAVLYRKSLAMGLKFKADRDGLTTIIDEADSLQIALKQLEQNDYKVVITDGMFPEQSGGFVSSLNEQDFRGNQVAKAAKSKGVELVIGLSADPQLFKGGVDMVFNKPVDMAELKQIVKERLEKELDKEKDN